jgi:hypothetical protein
MAETKQVMAAKAERRMMAAKAERRTECWLQKQKQSYGKSSHP